MAFGIISGTVTFGMGSVFTSSAGTTLANSFGNFGIALVRAMHAISQGMISLMQGKLFTPEQYEVLGSVNRSGVFYFTPLPTC